MNERQNILLLYFVLLHFLFFSITFTQGLRKTHTLFIFSLITFISQVPVYLFDPLSHTASTHCSYHPINQFNQHCFIMVVKKRQTQLFQQSQTLQHSHIHTTNTIHTARQSHTTQYNKDKNTLLKHHQLYFSGSDIIYFSGSLTSWKI